jgi:uncharacterized protein (TIRG00374 family)
VSWKTALGFAVSGLLIWLTLRGVDLGAVWLEIRGADLLLLGAAVFVATFGFFIRALRWRVLLHPILPDSGLRARWAAVNIGFMANNLLPARVGEFARAYSLARLEPRVSAGGALGSLVVERVLDGLVLAGFLVGAVLMPGFPEVELGGTFVALLKTAVTLIVGVMAVLVLLLIMPRRVVRVAEWGARRFLPGELGRAVVDALEAFLQAVGIVRSPLLLGQAFAWTVGFWAWHGLSFWLGMLAFDIRAGPLAAYFTEAVVGFGVALPAAPGFFGTFHYSVDFALSTVYGVAEAQTLAFAYGYHLGGFIPVTLIGLWYARELGLSLGEVRESEERVEESVEASLDAPTPSSPSSPE